MRMFDDSLDPHPKSYQTVPIISPVLHNDDVRVLASMPDRHRSRLGTTEMAPTDSYRAAGRVIEVTGSFMSSVTLS